MTAINKAQPSKLMRLEAIRGLAAMYVVAHHTIHFEYYLLGMNLGKLLRFGQEAVILFFVVSGFVIHFAYQSANDKSFKTYFVKRFFRIYVPLIVVVAFGVVAESYNGGGVVSVQLSQFLGNLFMLQDWPADKPGVLFDPLLGNDPLWSLSYEWWFYMLYFPLVQLAISRRQLSGVVFCIAVASALVYTVWPSFLPRLFMYGAIWWSGVYLAELYLNKQTITLKSCLVPLLALSAISFILLMKVVWWRNNGGFLTPGRHPLIEFRHTAFSLLAIVCAIVWHRLNWCGFDRLIGPFAIFAPISYAIYISHYHLMVTATWFDGIGNTIVIWTLYFVGLLVFSWAVELRLYPWVRRRVYAKLL